MGNRHIYLLRHGQYRLKDRDQGDLTHKGQQQARLTALALRDIPFTRIISSPVRRAVHTADLVAEMLPDAQRTQDAMLRECIPSIPDRYADFFAEHHPNLTPDMLTTCMANLDAAFDEYFAPFHDDGDIYELIVCHGNVIRYIVSRVLQMGATGWARMLINNCGITRVLVEGEDNMVLVSHNDIGHIPLAILTEN